MSIINGMIQRRNEKEQQKNDLELKLVELKQNIIAYKDLISTVSTMVYDKQNKAYLNQLSERLSGEFKDWRSYVLKSSKKSELVSSLVDVLSKTVKMFEEALSLNEKKLELIKQTESDNKIKEGYSTFWNKVHTHKEEYIRSFDKISEGIRAWDCLEALVLDGTVNNSNINEYGIQL